MNLQIQLSGDQAETAKAYALIKAEIKCLEDQAKQFKKELDVIITNSEAEYDDAVELMVDDKVVVTYSRAVYNYKFDYDISKFLQETKAYDLVEISVTKARTFLGEEKMREYFNKVVGSRKSYIGKLIAE
jgi:hypothetical protein